MSYDEEEVKDIEVEEELAIVDGLEDEIDDPIFPEEEEEEESLFPEEDELSEEFAGLDGSSVDHL